MENKLINKRLPDHNVLLFLLLVFNLVFKLILFYNTNSFYVSEAKSSYMTLLAIEKGAHPALFEGGYRSILAYMGYYIKSVTGTIDPFFWFQALLSTLSVYILYLICFKITNDKPVSLFAVLLATISMDYHLLTPVYYYQILEVFFVLLVVYLVLSMMDDGHRSSVVAVLLVPIIVYFSIFIRGTLSYFWSVLIAMSFYFLLRKKYGQFSKLAAAGIVTLILFSLLPHANYRNMNAKSVNDFKFYGHTLYGGDGGEGTFIYKENETRYKIRLGEFMIRHHYDSLTVKVRNEFQSDEMKEFISKTPQKWFLLQLRKIAFTFGIVPINDSLKLVTTGKLSMKWYLGAFIIQAPFVITLLFFVIPIVLVFKLIDLKNEKFFFMFIMFLYLLAATCLYGHYQERYRHVVLLAGILPLAAIYLRKFKASLDKKTIIRKRLILLIAVMFVILAFWSYQAYDALVLNKDRYVRAINQFASN